MRGACFPPGGITQLTDQITRRVKRNRRAAQVVGQEVEHPILHPILVALDPHRHPLTVDVVVARPGMPGRNLRRGGYHNGKVDAVIRGAIRLGGRL